MIATSLEVCACMVSLFTYTLSKVSRWEFLEVELSENAYKHWSSTPEMLPLCGQQGKAPDFLLLTLLVYWPYH